MKARTVLAGLGRFTADTTGCLLKTVLVVLAVAVLSIVLLLACEKKTLDFVAFPSPADRAVALRFELKKPESRDARKGFRAYLVGPDERRVLIGEGAGDLYRYTYWDGAGRVNVCPLAGRIRDGVAFNISGVAGHEQTVVVRTLCAPRGSPTGGR